MKADPADRLDRELEVEREYWQTRLANLEMLLCELLVKNERLRQECRLLHSMSFQSELAPRLPKGLLDSNRIEPVQSH